MKVAALPGLVRAQVRHEVDGPQLAAIEPIFSREIAAEMKSVVPIGGVKRPIGRFTPEAIEAFDTAA
jgi:hypothetical protein